MAKKSNQIADRTPPELIDEIIKTTLDLDEEKAMASLKKEAGFLKKLFFETKVVGAENIPEGPVLFISNHSTNAADTAVILPELQRAAGRMVRGMNDEGFYHNPRMRKFMLSTGAVMGHPKVGQVLFAADKDILLYPGGAHEANKDLSERYTIKWKKRTGFVRMAAKAGVPIVPVGLVGPDEWFDRYMDRGDVADSWLGPILRKAGVSEEFMQSDHMPPIPRGLYGSVLIPKPQKNYLAIGEPIATSRFKGKAISQKDQEKIRDIAKERLEGCISEMLLLQAQDRKNSGVLRKILSF